MKGRTNHIRRRTFDDRSPADGRSTLLQIGVGLTLKFLTDGLRDDSVREQGCQQTHKNYSVSSWKISRPLKTINLRQ
jgi:hypothetical protein